MSSITLSVMAVRKLVTARQREAARLLVAGMSANRALRLAGYSSNTAAHLGRIYRGSWGLRQAIREEQERQQHYLSNPAPQRRKRDRRPTVAVIQECNMPEDDSISNKAVHQLHYEQLYAERISKGLPPPARLQPTYEHFVLCPLCGQRVKEKHLMLNPSQDGYCCPHCAGM